MPALVCDEQKLSESQPQELSSSGGAPARIPQPCKQSQLSMIAKTAIMSSYHTPISEGAQTPEDHEMSKDGGAPPTKVPEQTLIARLLAPKHGQDGVGAALTDTPTTTAPNSPSM